MSDRKPLPTCKTCRYWSLATTGFDDLDSDGEHVEDDGTDPFFGAVGICQRFPPTKTMDEVDNVYDVACYPVARPGWGCGEHQPATVAESVGWSEDPPSVPGWYWYYHRSLASPLVCRVYTTPKNVWAEWGGGRRSNVKHWSGQWLPIITPTVADTTPAGT